jgi:NADH:ubiquinone oxidoreductase subunit 5 (subunit L)/multisubunit Na+/H+ antiporter MnhA subunit
MGAPVLVPALVHSSILVTANLYLLIRFRIAFNNWLNVIILLILVHLYTKLAVVAATF